jgi:3-hydroxyacyl-CoA dehydrogenase/enoyl-CoA hydratase/3-hydroxybutyryl-CoA epimerase
MFGWGFAPWTGGPFSRMDTVGIGHVVAVLERLAARHGERFAPTVQLQDMAASGAVFYETGPVREAA